MMSGLMTCIMAASTLSHVFNMVQDCYSVYASLAAGP